VFLDSFVDEDLFFDASAGDYPAVQIAQTEITTSSAWAF
jgi:hypothetical protein